MQAVGVSDLVSVQDDDLDLTNVTAAQAQVADDQRQPPSAAQPNRLQSGRGMKGKKKGAGQLVKVPEKPRQVIVMEERAKQRKEKRELLK